MSNILAGIGRGQLRVLDQRVTARRAIFDRYCEGLAHVRALRWMPEASYGRCTRWLSVCSIDNGNTPESVIRRLAQAGIEARHVWKPMHRQPLFRDCAYYPHNDETSFSDVSFNKGICLPSGSNMNPEQLERIIRTIGNIFAGD
jgi:pyridoxal phosphate-dependent aminotransferase EpsN